MSRVARAAIAGTAALLLAPAVLVLARSEQDPRYEVVPVRPGVHVIRGGGANTTVVEREGGIVVVDTKLARHAEALGAAIAKVRKAEVAWIVVTHHHIENCEAIRALAGAHTRVVAHELADRRMRASSGRGADVRFATRLSFDLGDETITCYHKGAGHTDGDVIVHFERANVLVTGGLVANGAHPAFVAEDGADLRGWVRVLEGLVRDFGGKGTAVVPGDGPPGGIELVERQLEYLRDVLATMEGAQRHGLTRAEALREAQPLREKYRTLTGDHFELLLDRAHDAAAK